MCVRKFYLPVRFCSDVYHIGHYGDGMLDTGRDRDRARLSKWYAVS